MWREIKKLGQFDNGDVLIRISPDLWNQIISNLAGLYINVDDPEADAQAEFILQLQRLGLPPRVENTVRRHIINHQMLYVDGRLMGFDDFAMGVSDDSLKPHFLEYKQFGAKAYQELKDAIRRYFA